MIDIQQLMDNLFDGSGILEGDEGDFSKVIEHLEKAELAQEAGVSLIVQLQMAEAILAMEQVCIQACNFDFEEVTNLLNVKSAIDQRREEVGPPEELGPDDLSRIEFSLQQLYQKDPQEARHRARQIKKRFGYQVELEPSRPQTRPEPKPKPKPQEDPPEQEGPEPSFEGSEASYWDEDSEDEI